MPRRRTAGSYRPYEPDQAMLLSAAPQGWLTAGHLAHHINDTVDALDQHLDHHRRVDGLVARADATRVTRIQVYANATGVFSSRKIELRLHDAWSRRVPCLPHALAATTLTQGHPRAAAG